MELDVSSWFKLLVRISAHWFLNLAAETAAYLTAKHPDYAVLAARIAISDFHTRKPKRIFSTWSCQGSLRIWWCVLSFRLIVGSLFCSVNPKNWRAASMISKEIYELVRDDATHARPLTLLSFTTVILATISASHNELSFHSRNQPPSSFGFKTLKRSYLFRINGRVAEQPQHMVMWVAVGIHGSDIDKVIETYSLMFERYFTHASPTLFNAQNPNWTHASLLPWKMTKSRVFMRLWRTVLDRWRDWSQYSLHSCYGVRALHVFLSVYV